MKTLDRTILSLLLLLATIAFILFCLPTLTVSAHPIAPERCHYVTLTRNCHAPIVSSNSVKTWNFIGPKKTELVQVGPTWSLTYTCSEGNGKLQIEDNQNIPQGPSIQMNCDHQPHILNRVSERALRSHAIATSEVSFDLQHSDFDTHTILILHTGL